MFRPNISPPHPPSPHGPWFSFQAVQGGGGMGDTHLKMEVSGPSPHRFPPRLWARYFHLGGYTRWRSLAQGPGGGLSMWATDGRPPPGQFPRCEVRRRGGGLWCVDEIPPPGPPGFSEVRVKVTSPCGEDGPMKHSPIRDS